MMVNEVSAKEEMFAKSKTDLVFAAIDTLKTEVSTLKGKLEN